MSYPQSTSAPPEPGENEYTVGWICAIQEEYEAARKMLDKTFKGPRMSRPRDDNTYKFGQIADHYVVIGCLPFGEYGTNSAAAVATNMVRSFPQVRFALMVGIGGGAPTARNDIRLGDVVVASRRGTNGGVVQLDSLRQHQTPEGSLELERFGHLNSPPRVVLGALPEVISRYEDSDEVDMIAENMKRMANRQDFFNRPSDDRLYRDDYIHQGGDTCDACDPDALVMRAKRDLAHRAVVVHYGTIGSSNSRIESAYERNRLANDPNLNILCFEMEAAGLMNTLPCLVIRGISDYADSHKKYSWHKYAALAAAAYARELLRVLQPDRVMEQPSWENVLNEVRELKYELNKDRRDRETEEILSWIAEDSEKKWHEVTHSDYYSKRHPGTGRWFEQHSEFQAWVHGRTHALFCHGPPGAGKSVIASIAINHLRTMQTAENSKCAYLYCNYGRENNGKQTAKHLFSILLRQLCEILGVSNLLREKQRQNTCLTLQDILMATSDIVESYGDVFIIVDALDECSPGDRDDLLQEIAKLQARNTVRFMATSRGDLSSIASQFEALSRKPCSTLEINAAEGDVHSFIEGSLDGIKALTRNSQLRHSIPMRITQAAGPLFLLARFHMKRLSAVDTVQDIEDFLGQLSTGQAGLGKEYDRSLDAIDRLEGPMRRRTYGLLSWVFHSGGSLDSRALRHALSIREGDTRLNTKNLPEIRDIVGRCEGFVAFDGEMETVKFAHATIQEHFQKNRVRYEEKGVMTVGQVALACVTYLSLDEFQAGPCIRYWDLERRYLDMPFYKYAAQAWGYHAHAATPEIETTKLILDFIENEDKVSAAAQVVSLEPVSYDSFPSFTDLVLGKVYGTALHLASYFGLGKLVEILLRRDHNPTARDVYGATPLTRAVQGGSKTAVSALLQGIAGVAVPYRNQAGVVVVVVVVLFNI
ncbi:hypothetical protein F5Y04DRAFT_257946 [Hypomontagnella monticulosa]|nr:hypothetical protein F5Y04DRAFT_257946 [Hypomontagnella monticulosa]